MPLVKARHTPERSCVACRQKLPKRALVRIVRTAQRGVKVDPNGKEAGRGAYLCWSPDCWKQGIDKGALERSLKVSISAEDRAQLTAFYARAVPGSITGER